MTKQYKLYVMMALLLLLTVQAFTVTDPLQATAYLKPFMQNEDEIRRRDEMPNQIVPRMDWLNHCKKRYPEAPDDPASLCNQLNTERADRHALGEGHENYRHKDLGIPYPEGPYTMHEYVSGILEGEVTDYPKEALIAMAVAARTVVWYRARLEPPAEVNNVEGVYSASTKRDGGFFPEKIAAPQDEIYREVTSLTRGGYIHHPDAINTSETYNRNIRGVALPEYAVDLARNNINDHKRFTVDGGVARSSIYDPITGWYNFENWIKETNHYIALNMAKAAHGYYDPATEDPPRLNLAMWEAIRPTYLNTYLEGEDPTTVERKYWAGHGRGIVQGGAESWALGLEHSWASGYLTPTGKLFPKFNGHQILVHYLTGVDIRDAGHTNVTPPYRWNPLEVTWEDTGNLNPPPQLVKGQDYKFTLVAQNTGTVDIIPNKTDPSDPDISRVSCWLKVELDTTTLYDEVCDEPTTTLIPGESNCVLDGDVVNCTPLELTLNVPTNWVAFGTPSLIIDFERQYENGQWTRFHEQEPIWYPLEYKVTVTDGPAQNYYYGPSRCESFEYLPWGFQRGVHCGIQMLRDTLVGLDIEYTDEELAEILADPPVPGMQFDNAPNSNNHLGAISTSLDVPVIPGSGSVNQSWLSEHTLLFGSFTAVWESDAWVGTPFSELRVAQAAVYDEADQLIGTGAVRSQGLGIGDQGLGLAVVLGNDVSYQVEGEGSMAFYAPAVNGLGLAGRWLTQTSRIDSHSQYGLGLSNAQLTLNGQVYSGTFVLLTDQPTTLQGRGAFRSPNFAGRGSGVRIQGSGVGGQESGGGIRGVALQLGQPTPKSLRLTPNSVLTISQYNNALDQLELAGTIERDLALTLDPPTSQIAPLATTTVRPVIALTQTGSPSTGSPSTGSPSTGSPSTGSGGGGGGGTAPVTLTVRPPAGWQATLNEQTGHISLTPPPTATAGDYPLYVSVQDLTGFQNLSGLFATAIHTVTLLPHTDFSLSAALDPLTTVPWGTADPNAPDGSINNGQVQVPAAYIATLTNTASAEQRFNLTIIPHGFPVEWLTLGGVGRQPTTTLTLPAGGTGNLGGYLT